MLKILKASAGSGKTFTLAGEYIRLFLQGNLTAILMPTGTSLP